MHAVDLTIVLPELALFVYILVHVVCIIQFIVCTYLYNMCYVISYRLKVSVVYVLFNCG